MYSTPPRAVHPDLVELAGGTGKVAERAQKLLYEGKTVEAIHLADVALSVDPKNPDTWKIRLQGLERLLKESRNSNGRGWLTHGVRQARQALGQ